MSAQPEISHGGTQIASPAINTQTSSLVLDAQSMNAMMKLAEIMSKGTVTVPKHLANSPADCLAVVMQSMQWHMNPYAVAQKTHLVNGNLGYEAQLVNAVVQASGAISGAFKYEYRGDGEQMECRVGAVLRGESVVTWGEWLRLASVTTRNSPLWKANPRQQIGYLQVKNWARLYCPGAILGVYTPDELESIPIRDITPQPQSDGRTSLPEVTDEDFKTKMTKWRPLVEGGTKTATEMLAFAASKYALTDAQKAEILALKIATADTADNATTTQEQPQ